MLKKKHNYQSILVIILVLLSILSPLIVINILAGDNPQQLWIKYYDDIQDDKAYAVTTDSNNNIIVTGHSKINGLDKCLTIKYSPKTVFVQTWHGGDIKVVGINTIPYFKNIIYSNLTRFLGLKLRFHQLFDYMVSPSKAEKPIKILVDSFKFPKKRILPLGYPRNDIFFSKDKTLKEKLRQKYNISNNYERIVLYDTLSFSHFNKIA